MSKHTPDWNKVGPVLLESLKAALLIVDDRVRGKPMATTKEYAATVAEKMRAAIALAKGD